LLAGTVSAQILMGSYYAEIGPEDRRNSSGTALTEAGGILQQDRANVHRFGIRHAGDQMDRVFDTPDLRTTLPDLFRRSTRAPGVDAGLLGQSGAHFRILVLLCGDGRALSHVVVDEVGGTRPLGCAAP
jgi:hypothetical protein